MSVQTYTWEELCQEWLLRATGGADLPFLPDQVGGAWTRKAQVDVVGINSMEKTLFLGECKWSPKAVEQDVLTDLVQKTAEFVPTEGRWRVYYLGFARGGWSREALALANTFQSASIQGENWRAVGMSLQDLAQVDQDLKEWSQVADDQADLSF